MTHPSPSGPQPSGPGRPPRLGEVVRDVERLVRQARDILGREIDPASYPDGTDGHLADASLQVLKFQLEAAMRELGEIAALSVPPVGSAVAVAFAWMPICGHCERKQRGYGAISSAGRDVLLCHPDEGMDCYRLVTVYGHATPCVACAAPAPGRTAHTGRGNGPVRFL